MKTKSVAVFVLALLLLSGLLASGILAQDGPAAEPVITNLQSFEVTEDGVRPAGPAERGAAAAEGADTRPRGPDNAPQAATLTGIQPWVTLMCKFSDFADEPHDVAWHQGMYSDTFPGLGHYFNEASFGQMSLTGSTASGWFTLPNPRAAYTWPDGSLIGAAVILDCISAADATVNFVPYSGIAVMVNTNLGAVFAAGSVLSTLDGELEERMVTAAPLALYTDVGNVALAMSNALHMHPSGDALGTLQPDVWNAVGSGLLNCSPGTTYGCRIQHADMVNRDHLEWVLPERTYSAMASGVYTVTLKQAAQPSAGDYVMAELPLFVPTDHSRLVIEARRQVGYDVHLPGSAVIIHRDHYIENQAIFFPAPELITDGSNPGAMWTVGETYVDAVNGFEVHVDSATADGFVVTLTRHPRGQIIVQNELDNSNTNQSFGYTTSYAGAFNLSTLNDTHTSGPLPAATNYSVTPTTQPAGWLPNGSSCNDGSNPSAIDLADGERVTCTFHYLRQPSDIIISKVAIPAGTGQLFSFSSPQFPNFQLEGGQSSNRTFLTPGTYSVSETNVPPGWELTSATCDNGETIESIDVTYGEVVTCTFTNTELPDPDPYEPNDSLAAATSIAYGETKTGAFINPVGDFDFYRFNGTAGEAIIATVLAQVNGSPLDSHLRLLDAAGATLLNNNDGPGIGKDSQISFVLPATGVYYLRVVSFPPAGGLTYFYNLRLQLAPPPPTSTNSPTPVSDPFEPNNSPAQSTAISYGETKSDALISPAGDQDYFMFNGGAGDEIEATVLAQAIGSVLDSYLRLYAANGTTLLAENDDTNGLDPQIIFTLPSTGVYYLSVRHWQDAEGGPNYFYDLQLEADVTPPTPTNTPTRTPTATNTPSPTPTATNTPTGGSEFLYVSSTTGGNAGGIAFADEDVLRQDRTSGAWTMFFDGSDVGLGGADVDAFERLANGHILLSLDAEFTLPDVGLVDDSDIVRFTPTSTGSVTAGTFAFYFDGSDVDLTTDAEDVDGLAFAPDGRLLISAFGTAMVTGSSSALDEDVLAFTMTQEGANTAGSWSFYFDGSDVGLNTTATEDVNSIWSGASGPLYMTTLGDFAVSGLSGQGGDVFTCTPGSFGAATACTFGLYWDSAANSFGTEIVDALALTAGGTPPTPTPSPTTGPSPTPTSTPTATATPPAGGPWVYVGSNSGGTVSGVSFADEDIVRHNPTSGVWQLFFDGSDVGLGGTADVDAFEVLANGDILLSTDAAVTLPTVGAIDDSDIVRFIPTSTGTNTSGTYAFYVDGSDIALTTDGEDIDAFDVIAGGDLLISTLAAVNVPGAAAADEDLIRFTPTTLGATTAGTFALHFDGSDVGLTDATENVGGVWRDDSTGMLFLSTNGAFTVTGVSGTAADIFACTPGTLGTNTSCTFSMFWDGSTHGFGTEVLDSTGFK